MGAMPTSLPVSEVRLGAIRQNGRRFAHWRSNFRLAETKQ